MKRSFIFILSILALSSCKTEYERIRTSNEPEKIYNAAKQYYEKEDYLKAQSLYELVIPYYRGREEAEDLFYKFAYTHYNTGQYILASHYFNSFSKTFYNSPKKEECEFMAAYSNLQLSPNHRLDQSYSEKAIEEFQNFTNRYPNSERVAECNQIIDDLRLKLELKAFEQGQLYYNLNNYLSAISAFDNMLKDYPDSDKAETVRYLILKSSHEWAKNSIYTKKRERFNETLKRYKQFKSKYPNSEKIKEADDINNFALQEIKKLSNV